MVAPAGLLQSMAFFLTIHSLRRARGMRHADKIRTKLHLCVRLNEPMAPNTCACRALYAEDRKKAMTRASFAA